MNPISDLYREAYDRVQSGGTGAGWSGIHYELMNVLRRYGKIPNWRNLTNAKKTLFNRK